MTTNCLIGTARGSLKPELDGFWLKSVRDKDKRLCIYWDLKEQMSLTLESDEPLKHSYKSRSWLCRTFLTSNLPSCWEALEMVKHNRLCKTCQHSMGERCLQPLHVPSYLIPELMPAEASHTQLCAGLLFLPKPGRQRELTEFMPSDAEVLLAAHSPIERLYFSSWPQVKTHTEQSFIL